MIGRQLPFMAFILPFYVMALYGGRRSVAALWPVNADIALAAARHVQWTGDADFDRGCALPMLVETARLWTSLGYYGDDDKFHIDGVTGPDEYSALVDDNTYTNLTAARNLRYAADAADRWPADAATLERHRRDASSGGGPTRRWPSRTTSAADAGAASRLDPPRALGLRGDRARTPATRLLLNYPYFEIYRRRWSSRPI